MSEARMSKLEEMATRIACADLSGGLTDKWLHARDEAWLEKFARSSVALALKIIAEADKHGPSSKPTTIGDLTTQTYNDACSATREIGDYLPKSDVCIVCGKDSVVPFYRGHPANRKVHCNQCGSEVTRYLHDEGQPKKNRTAAVPTAGEGAP